MLFPKNPGSVKTAYIMESSKLWDF